VDVFGAESEHPVDEASERMRGGGDGRGRSEARFQAAVEGAEGGPTMGEGTGGHTERGRHAAGGGFGSAAERLAPRDLAAGREAEPGGEMLLGGPPGQFAGAPGNPRHGRRRAGPMGTGRLAGT